MERVSEGPGHEVAQVKGDRVFNTREAAEFLQVHPVTLRKGAMPEGGQGVALLRAAAQRMVGGRLARLVEEGEDVSAQDERAAREREMRRMLAEMRTALRFVDAMTAPLLREDEAAFYCCLTEKQFRRSL